MARRRVYFWNQLSAFEKRHLTTIAWRKLLASEVVAPADRDEFMEIASMRWSEIHPALQDVLDHLYTTLAE